MDTQAIQIDRDEAARLYRKYRAHRAWSQPMDDDIRRIYHAISKGKMVIAAFASIAKAGLGPDGLPHLAIARADAQWCHLNMGRSGEAVMNDSGTFYGRNAASRHFEFPRGTFPARQAYARARAAVPHIPPDLRPQRGMANYHILWEAEWSAMPPVDPLLLRRIGKGDAWIVVAAWNLTEVERAVMAGYTFAQH